MDVKRSSGDKDIDYLVNDSGLNLGEVKDKRIIIVGERHQNASDEGLVRKLIELIKPDFVLVEALGDYRLLSTSQKKKLLKLDEDKHYYHGFTKHWIEISLEYDIPFIGMEYTAWKKGEYEKLSLEESLKIREDHWMKMIKNYGTGSKIIVVCGDTHLRTIKTDQLGRVSPLYEKYNGKADSVVIRSAEGEIE